MSAVLPRAVATAVALVLAGPLAASAQPRGAGRAAAGKGTKVARVRAADAERERPYASASTPARLGRRPAEAEAAPRSGNIGSGVPADAFPVVLPQTFALPVPPAGPVIRGETPNECGMACVGMVLGSKGRPVAPADIRQASQLYPGSYSPSRGTRLDNLTYLLRHYGISASEPMPGQSLAQLERALEGGRHPAIFHLNIRPGTELAKWLGIPVQGPAVHSVVVDRVQLNPLNGRWVFIRDPFQSPVPSYALHESFFEMYSEGWAIYSSQGQAGSSQRQGDRLPSQAMAAQAKSARAKQAAEPVAVRGKTTVAGYIEIDPFFHPGVEASPAERAQSLASAFAGVRFEDKQGKAVRTVSLELRKLAKNVYTVASNVPANGWKERLGDQRHMLEPLLREGSSGSAGLRIDLRLDDEGQVAGPDAVSVTPLVE